jgi:hypothetical protein
MLRILQESETGILLASQQAMSLGFNAWQHHRKCLPVRHQISFRGRGRQLAWKKSDHGVLHRKETYHGRCSSKR